MAIKYAYNEVIAVPVGLLSASQVGLGTAADFDRIKNLSPVRMSVSGMSGSKVVQVAGTAAVTESGTSIKASLEGLKGDNAVAYTAVISKLQDALVGTFTEAD